MGSHTERKVKKWEIKKSEKWEIKESEKWEIKETAPGFIHSLNSVDSPEGVSK